VGGLVGEQTLEKTGIGIKIIINIIFEKLKYVLKRKFS
jgi:hypothetical protein